MARTLGDEEMVRLSIRIPSEAQKEIYAWAEQTKVKPSYFCSMALVIGARQLMRQLSPEQFVTADMMRTMVEALGIDVPGTRAQWEQAAEEMRREGAAGLEREAAAGREQESSAA